MDAQRCVIVFARSEVEVDAEPGQLLLEVAEAHDVELPSLCRGGSCGTCKVKLEGGEPQIDTAYALTAAQRRAGFILACSARTVAGQRIVLDA